MQTVTITLTVAGTDTGPFDLYSDTDGYTTPFESGIAKAALVLGYTSVLVPDAATIIRVQSDSACTNFVDLDIVTTTTTTTSTTTSTTSTTSTTTTEGPVYCTEGCLRKSATGEAPEGADFWYITCEGVYTEVNIPYEDTFEFCVCDIPDQYSIFDVTIAPLGSCEETTTTTTSTTTTSGDLELVGNIVFNNLGVTTDYRVTFAGSYLVDLSAPAGGNDLETDTMPHAASVFIIVDKLSNAGIAQEDVLVQWFREGVLQHTDTVLTGNLVNTVYTIVGVNPTDELKVEITEAT